MAINMTAMQLKQKQAANLLIKSTLTKCKDLKLLQLYCLVDF